MARVSGLGGEEESMEGRVPGHESSKSTKELEICLSAKGVCVLLFLFFSFLLRGPGGH